MRASIRGGGGGGGVGGGGWCGLSFGRSVILGPHFGLIYEETFGLMLVGQNCITEHMQFILGQYTVARVISVE